MTAVPDFIEYDEPIFGAGGRLIATARVRVTGHDAVAIARDGWRTRNPGEPDIREEDAVDQFLLINGGWIPREPTDAN